MKRSYVTKENQWVTGCLKKVSLDTFEQAKEFAQNKANEFNKSFVGYICPDCGSIHLTKNIEASGKYKPIFKVNPTIKVPVINKNILSRDELLEAHHLIKRKSLKTVANTLNISRSSLKKQLKKEGLFDN